MDNTTLQLLLGFLAIFASGGFWSWVSQKREKKSSSKELLMGLALDKIVYLASKYIERGYVTHEEYTTLYTYLWAPYRANGGNGPAERMMHRVSTLPDENGFKQERKEVQ